MKDSVIDYLRFRVEFVPSDSQEYFQLFNSKRIVRSVVATLLYSRLELNANPHSLVEKKTDAEVNQDPLNCS